MLFQGASEYQRKYAWVRSHKSASFEPTVEQGVSPAGVPSSKLGNPIFFPECSKASMKIQRKEELV